MGAWGEEVFENDDACDFAAEVTKTKGLSKVQEALDAVLREDDYLEASTASEGLAAADIVARLRGLTGQTDAYTEKLDSWIEQANVRPSEQILKQAIAVVSRVRTAPSELLELWSEDDPTAWLATLDALQQRLTEAA